MNNDISNMKLHEVRRIKLNDVIYPNSPSTRVIRVPDHLVYFFPEGPVTIPVTWEKTKAKEQKYELLDKRRT